MAGTRDNIARWRRIKHVAMVLCVLCAILWVATCAVSMGAYRIWGPNLQVSHGSVSFCDMNNFGIEDRIGFDAQTSYDFEVRLHWPALLPRWGNCRIEYGGTPILTREFEVPLWPTPAAFGVLAWYANTRIKRLRQGACAKCGYDTHGLAAGAPCPECGTPCTG